jgi:putative transposase
MSMSLRSRYAGHRFPPEIISHAIWLYFRFPLSLRLVEELLLERGSVVSYETIRRWAAKFSPAIARGVRRRASRPGDIWHLDEVRVVIRGEVHWRWRAVDQHGAVLDEIVQRRRDKRAAKRLLVSLLKRQGWTPRRIVTDKLASYGAAKREVAPGIEHRSHKGLNNRAENAHVQDREPPARGKRFIAGAAGPPAIAHTPAGGAAPDLAGRTDGRREPKGDVSRLSSGGAGNELTPLPSGSRPLAPPPPILPGVKEPSAAARCSSTDGAALGRLISRTPTGGAVASVDIPDRLRRAASDAAILPGGSHLARESRALAGHVAKRTAARNRNEPEPKGSR